MHDDGYDSGTTVNMTVFELFKEIVDDACEIGGGRLLQISKVDDKEGHKTDLGGLWHSLQSQIKKAYEHPETEFLVHPLLEMALTKVLYLYPLTMQQVLNTPEVVAAKASKVKSLQKLLQNDSLKNEWCKLAERIKAFSSQFGAQLVDEDVTDLAENAHIILDAIRVPDEWGSVKLQRGRTSDQKPVVYWNMPRFYTLSDFYDCFNNIRSESCIVFALIQERIRDTINPFENWLKGYESELVRNTIRHGGTLDDPYVYTTRCVVGIKRGENIWYLFERGADEVVRSKTFRPYGDRKSFMPYQAVFTGSEEKTTDLVVRGNPSWDVRQIIDKEQAIWLPVMLYSVEKAFFTGNIDPLEEIVIQGKGIAISAPNARNAETALAICMTYKMPNAFVLRDDVASSTYNDFIIETLKITPDDIADAPFSFAPNEKVTESEIERKLWLMGRFAILRCANERAKADYDRVQLDFIQNGSGSLYRNPNPPATFSKDFVAACQANTENIISMINDPNSPIQEITSIVVNGEEYESTRGWGPKTIKATTSIDDGRKRRHDTQTAWFFLPPEQEGKRPPYSIRIIPRSFADLALLVGDSPITGDWRYQLWKRDKNATMNTDSRTQDPLNNYTHPYDSVALQVRIAVSKRECKKLFPSLDHISRSKDGRHE